MRVIAYIVSFLSITSIVVCDIYSEHRRQLKKKKKCKKKKCKKKKPIKSPNVTPTVSPISSPVVGPIASSLAPSAKCCACESLSSSSPSLPWNLASPSTCAIDCGEEDSGTLIGLEDADLYDRRNLHNAVAVEQGHLKLGLCIRTPFAGGRVRFIGCNTIIIALIPEDSDGVFGGPPPGGWTHTVNPGTGPTYFSVDGFCIKGMPLSYVKIGDHCDVTFTCTPGGGITYERCCNLCASLFEGVPSVLPQKPGAWPHCDAIPGWPNAVGGINP